jgi:hypothetical protein
MSKLLKLNDSGIEVRRLQELLVKQGSVLSIDGIFGSKTESAVKSLQSKNGITNDGLVGIKTWSVLEKNSGTKNDKNVANEKEIATQQVARNDAPKPEPQKGNINYRNIKELGNNSSFSDKLFQTKMGEVGWRSGLAWCLFFAKHIWKEFKIKNIKGFDYKKFSGHCVATYNANRDVATKDTSGLLAGSLILWQSKSNSNSGHAGIFLKQIDAETILTLEGNTSKDRNGVADREGDGVYLKVRKYRNCGFNFLGFIGATEQIEFQSWLQKNINFEKNSWMV